jgi:uncharacterized protein
MPDAATLRGPPQQADSGIGHDQRAAIDFLADPVTHGGVERVERFETHGNVVFLAGTEAFKIKRAVRFDYMDFSTLEKRRIACLREFEVNQRCGGDLYLGCVPIRRSSAGHLSFSGDGEIVEWAVKMRRFDQADLFSTLAEQGKIDADLAKQLASAVYGCHASAHPAAPTSGTASLQDLASSIVGALGAADLFDKADTSRLALGLKRQLKRTASLLDERARRGFVRRCHGDLHLANIVLWRGRPTLYDAIEFDESLATIDTLYDLAFLLMDLDFRGQRPAANIVLNQYLWRGRQDWDLQGLAGLPLFLALRAAIRARVTVDRAAQEQGQARDEDLARARRYLQAAIDYVEPSAPQLVAVAGLSGSGKTTLAAALAPCIGSAPGALHLRSDLERKALAGVGEFERLPDSAYTAEARQRVYGVLRDKSKMILAANHSVIVDAVYDAESDRDEIEAMARTLGVPFRAFWLQAEARKLLARVAARHNDASDATASVVQAQLGLPTGRLSPAWKPLNAGASASETLRLAMAAADLGPPRN